MPYSPQGVKGFDDDIVEKIKTHILCSITHFLKSYCLRDNVEKYDTAGQTTDDNTAYAHYMMCT